MSKNRDKTACCEFFGQNKRKEGCQATVKHLCVIISTQTSRIKKIANLVSLSFEVGERKTTENTSTENKI
jgi:hypothetical protein